MPGYESRGSRVCGVGDSMAKGKGQMVQGDGQGEDIVPLERAFQPE